MAALVPAMYAHALLGAVFTHSPWPAPAIVTFLFYGIVALAEHRDAGNGHIAEAIWMLTTVQAASLFVGSVVGLLFVAIFRTPRLIDVRIFYEWDSIREQSLQPAKETWDPLLYVWPVLTLLSGILTLAGLYCLMGGLWHGSNALLTQTQAVSLGLIFVIIGGGATIAGLVQLWRSHAPTGLPGKLTAKYMFFVAVLLVVPHIFWTAHYATANIRAAIVIVTVATLWLAVYWGSNDVFLGSTKHRSRSMTAILVLAFIHETAWAAAWAALDDDDNDADKAAGNTFLAVGIGAAVWMGILLCLGKITGHLTSADVRSTKRAGDNGKMPAADAKQSPPSQKQQQQQYMFPSAL